MSSKVALQVNALIGLASTIAASAMMTLVLTRPRPGSDPTLTLTLVLIRP